MEAVTYCGFYCKRCPEYDKDCAGCRQGGADPSCQVRLCAQERFPFLREEAAAIRRHGIEKWMVEQEQKVDSKYY